MIKMKGIIQMEYHKMTQNVKDGHFKFRYKLFHKKKFNFYVRNILKISDTISKL